MVSFHNYHSPGWMCLDRKPHKMINECRNVDFCETHIVLHVKLVEGKDRSTEGVHASTEFEVGKGCKIASLCLRMKK